MTAELHRSLTADLGEHPGVELADDALWSPATVGRRRMQRRLGAQRERRRWPTRTGAEPL